MKVGDLIKTKVSLMDNRVPIGELGLIVEKSSNENKILIDSSSKLIYPLGIFTNDSSGKFLMTAIN